MSIGRMQISEDGETVDLTRLMRVLTDLEGRVDNLEYDVEDLERVVKSLKEEMQGM